VLYALFVPPMFDIDPVLSSAYNSYNIKLNKSKNELIADMEKSLEAITKGLKQSGLKVNDYKTYLCLFYKNDTTPIMIKIGDKEITSKSEINVLGAQFDAKLQQSNHISKVVNKANRAQNAIKLIRKYFNAKELIQ
jgi:hypothetical protein